MTARAALRAMLRQRRELTVLTIWSLIGALPTFVTGHALARALDHGFLADDPRTGLAWLGCLAVTIPVGAWGTSRTYLCVAKLVEPLRDDLVHLVVDGSLRRSTDPGAPRDSSAVARLTQHVESVRDNVAGLLLLISSFVAGMVAALTGVVTLAPLVLPHVLVPLLVSSLAFVASLPAVTRQQRRLLLADERTAELSADVAEGLRDVVACGGEERVTASLHDRIDEQAAAGSAVARVTAGRTVIMAVGGRLPLVLVLISAGWLLDRGLTPGALLGTLTYLGQGLEPAVSALVGSVGAPVAQLVETLRRIDDALPQPPPAGEHTETANEAADADAAVDADADVTRVTGTAGRTSAAAEAGTAEDAAARSAGSADAAPPGDGELALRGVTFRYREAAEPVLQDLDLVIPEGDHLAVVGPSGAGKSTLAALLVGMLTPQEGTVSHGGQPATQVPASQRVLIPQQAYAFRGTLADNLRYLHPAATTADLDRAVAAVGMEELAARLGGYDAVLEPATLSAGERQLVALARAYVSPARVVLLDEATCHLDPTAEAVAEEAFAARGGTLVVVAHRISSARRADRALVMDGHATVVGTHDELIDRSPLYRDLVGHWFAYEPQDLDQPAYRS